MKRSKNFKKYIVAIFSIIIILVIIAILYNFNKEPSPIAKKEKVENKLDLTEVKANYNNYVKVQDKANLYEKKDNKYEKVSTINGSIEISLDPNYEITDEYFKLLNNDYYVKYNEVQTIESLTPKSEEYKYYKNYIPYNENIELKNNAKLYVDANNYYEVSKSSYPIIIKDNNQYGIEYNNELVYVNKTDVEKVVENTNTEKKSTEGLAVLNYHYTVSGSNENGELDECTQTICVTDTMFDSHIKYLKENGYYATSMRDLELFIDGKIRLPEKSVTLTFDDGWYVARTIRILEKYQMLGTLFLIGSLASPNDYRSQYLEVHSHTWDMHTPGVCPSSMGRGGILCLDENKILEDLKKSRESLNNTPYFCYPFYDYNERAIELLKKAGFRMAFAGELNDSTVRVGQDKYRIPRYVIVNYTTMNDFIRYVS